MFKDMNIKKVSLWLFIIMVLAFTIAATIFFQTGGYDVVTVQHNIDDSKNFNTEGINEIKVNSVSADINIIPVDSNEVTAHLYGNVSTKNTTKYPKLTWKIENNTIVIKVVEPLTIGININIYTSLKLDVSIPKSYKNDLSTNTTSGETYINNFDLNRFQNHTVSGDLKAGKLNTKSSKISSVSGEATMTDFTGDLTAHSVSGDFEINYSSFNNNIDVDTTSGKTEISLPENSEFSLDFDTVSGDAKCNFPIMSEGYKRKGLTGSVGSAGNVIHVTSVSGDLRILK